MKKKLNSNGTKSNISKNNINISSKKSKALSNKRSLKRAVLLITAIFVLLIAAYFCLDLYNTHLQYKNAEKYGESDPTNLNFEGKSFINYYEPDYETDIFTDSDYLEKNRKITYISFSESSTVSIILDEYESSELTEGQRFIISYFKAVAHGNYEKYQEMFTDEYLEDPNGFEKNPSAKRFPKQRIYDITVTELSRTNPLDNSNTYDGKAAIYGAYELSYKILKNDGEFRYDLTENGMIPVIIETITVNAGNKDEKTLINKIYKSEEAF